MKMTLLVLHRKERYEGEYLPEVISVVDEVTMDENPQWWDEELRKQKSIHHDGSDISAWAEIEIEVPTEDVMKALYPKTETIPAEVLPPAAGNRDDGDQSRLERLRQAYDEVCNKIDQVDRDDPRFVELHQKADSLLDQIHALS